MTLSNQQPSIPYGNTHYRIVKMHLIGSGFDLLTHAEELSEIIGSKRFDTEGIKKKIKPDGFCFVSLGREERTKDMIGEMWIPCEISKEKEYDETMGDEIWKCVEYKIKIGDKEGTIKHLEGSRPTEEKAFLEEMSNSIKEESGVDIRRYDIQKILKKFTIEKKVLSPNQ